MSVNLQGLEDNARKTSITELQAAMADSTSLSMALKQAHWNMKGATFIAVHELMDEVKDRLDEQLDNMAERIQQLDGVAVGTVEEVARTTQLKPYPTDLTKVSDHVREIADRLRSYGARVRHAIDATDGAGDTSTADVLTEASRQADKDLWFVQSHLD